MIFNVIPRFICTRLLCYRNSTRFVYQVAVKIIDKKKSREDSYVRKNLRREGKILQMIRHSNIVHLLEIMETQNSYYLVTELCRGGDLMDYISQKRKLPETEVKKYIRQIVSAVDYLHRLGILHRYVYWMGLHATKKSAKTHRNKKKIP